MKIHQDILEKKHFFLLWTDRYTDTQTHRYAIRSLHRIGAWTKNSLHYMIFFIMFVEEVWSQSSKWYQTGDNQLLYSRENGVRWDVILYRKSMGSVLVVWIRTRPQPENLFVMNNAAKTTTVNAGKSREWGNRSVNKKMSQKRPLEKRVQVITGQYRARGNIAITTTNGNASTSLEWGGIDPWWKRPLKMHVQVVTSPYRVRGGMDEQCRKMTIENARTRRFGTV